MGASIEVTGGALADMPDDNSVYARILFCHGTQNGCVGMMLYDDGSTLTYN